MKVDLFMSIGSTSVQAKLTCSGGDIASTFLLVFYRGFFFIVIYTTAGRGGGGGGFVMQRIRIRNSTGNMHP